MFICLSLLKAVKVKVKKNKKDLVTLTIRMVTVGMIEINGVLMVALDTEDKDMEMDVKEDTNMVVKELCGWDKDLTIMVLKLFIRRNMVVMLMVILLFNID